MYFETVTPQTSVSIPTWSSAARTGVTAVTVRHAKRKITEKILFTRILISQSWLARFNKAVREPILELVSVYNPQYRTINEQKMQLVELRRVIYRVKTDNNIKNGFTNRQQ